VVALNNTFNLIYTLLKYRVYSAVLGAHLEPMLGFVRTEAVAKASLVLDLMEVWRSLCDDFLVGFSKGLGMGDFVLKDEWFSTNRLGKRQVLSEGKSGELSRKLDEYFERKVDIPRIKHGNRSSLDTLINEEVFVLAKYLRGEREKWIPRLPNPFGLGTKIMLNQEQKKIS